MVVGGWWYLAITRSELLTLTVKIKLKPDLVNKEGMLHAKLARYFRNYDLMSPFFRKFSIVILPESSPANPTPSFSQVTSGSGSPENQRS